MGSPVTISEYDIDASNDADQVSHQVTLCQERQGL
jgi:hypothetical protein